MEVRCWEEGRDVKRKRGREREREGLAWAYRVVNEEMWM